MEKVQGQEVDRVEVFENDIEFYLKKFCEEQKIEDMKKEPQSVWNAALMYIRRNVFGSSSVLKDKTPINGYTNNSYTDYKSNLNYSNCNRYNIDMINSICDYYIYISMLYAKEVSVIGFSNLIGVPTQTIYLWGSGEQKLSKTSIDVYKKLHEWNEESLSNILISGTRPPVGAIAALNRRHGWSSPYTSDANKDRKTLTSADVRALLSESGGQIEQKDNI